MQVFTRLAFFMDMALQHAEIMMKKIMFLVGCLFLVFAQAETLEYENISPIQPTQNKDKIEVIEFFWYGCPHCYSLEPVLTQWLKTIPDNVEFIRQPTIFNSLWGKHAKAFFVAQVLGIADEVHADLFDAIQNKKLKLTTESQLAKFFAKHGVDETKFNNAFNSFFVDTRLRQAKIMTVNYGITGVPAIVINGKYKTSGTLAKTYKNMFKVINRLIQQESQSK